VVETVSLKSVLLTGGAAAFISFLVFGRIGRRDKHEKTGEKKDDHVVTTLTEPRGSAGMGLPDKLSQATIDTVVATAPVVAPKALDITKNFYTNMFKKHPTLLAYFNPAHNIPISIHQPKALAASIVAYASNISDLSPLLVPGGPVEAICHRHCALAVYPQQYTVVYENVMAAIAKVLGSVVSPEIGAAWSEAVLFLAKAFIDLEESIYQMLENREGGWSGPIPFEVSEIVDVAKDVKSISFKPPKGSILEKQRFEFSPGQYLSLQIDIDGDGLTAPRHYTVTSPPFADFLQCTVKKIPGGKLSTYVHENLKVGDTVKLLAPLGVFTAEPKNVESAVLMSAGIGVTPMVTLRNALGDKVKLSVHVDRTPEAHAYRKDFQDSCKCFDSYSYGKTRVSPKDLVQQTLTKVGNDHVFFICGPEEWMDCVQKELLQNGAKKVMCEVFGSQMATGCPFFQYS